MADTDDSLIKFQGESWSFWAQNTGLCSPNSDVEDDEGSKPRRDAITTTTRLKKEEMPIYGYCPRWEDFYLVVCDICGQSIKPQALRQHMSLRHSNATYPIKSEYESDALLENKSRKRKLKQLSDVLRGSSVSPIQTSMNKDFGETHNLEYKSSVYSGECNKRNTLSRNSENTSANTHCSFLPMQEEISPLLKMTLKGEDVDEGFIQNHASPSCPLTSYLPPPSLAETHHILQTHSPHTVHPSNMGSSIPTNLNQAGIGPPTPGRRPPTPGTGPPTPGIGPATPGRGPPTPGLGPGPPTPGLGPPTPGVGGPLTPGMNPPTPGMKPPTPGKNPPTPIMNPPTQGINPLTPGMNPPTPGVGPPVSGMLPVNQNIVLQSQGIINQSSASHSHPQMSSMNSFSVSPDVGPLPVSSNMSNLTSNYIQGTSNHLPTVVETHGANLNTLPQNLGNLMHNILTTNLVSQPQALSSQENSFVPQSSIASSNMVSVNVSCDPVQTFSQLGQVDLDRQVRRVSPSLASAEEEVNRISAMLMKEAEALTAPQGYQSLNEGNSANLLSRVTSHDIIEAEGLAAGAIRRGPLLTSINTGTTTSISNRPILTSSAPLRQNTNLLPTSSQQLGSVTVNMSNMSMATLKQIQADLLATVSESDLNAVLDGPVLPSNSHCFNENNNLQFPDRSNSTSEQFLDQCHLQNQETVHFNPDTLSMPVVDHYNPEVLSETDRSPNVMNISSSLLQRQFSNNQSDILDSANHSLQFNEFDKAHCDELSKAVDSITQLCQESNSTLDPQLVGLLQQPASTSSTPVGQSSSPISLNNLNVAPVSQGITVVIGGTQDSASVPISLASLATSLKKPSIVSVSGGNSNNLVHNLLSGNLSSPQREISSQDHLSVVSESQDSISQPLVSQVNQQLSNTHILTQTTVPRRSIQQPQTQTHQQTFISQQPQTPQSFSQVQQLPQGQSFVNSSMTAPTVTTPPTPSPKKSNKKKKPGERKLLPLKDREYDPEIHCGVVVSETGKPCTRSLTCKTHSLTLRRNVSGRSKKFDELLCEHKAAKGTQAKATKPQESPTAIPQSPSPRGPMGLTSTNSIIISSNSGHIGSSGHVAFVGTTTSSTPVLVRPLGAAPSYSCPPHPEPFPTSSTQFHSMDPPSTPSTHLQTTPPSPAYWSSQRLAPPLCHGDNFYVQEPSKPLATCSYNARRLGGFLATDHQTDSLRSAFSNALKKPQLTTIINDTSLNNIIHLGNANERYNNVKPLLARKLQSTIPTNIPNKEGIGVGIGYNGHIQLSNNNSVGISNSTLAATLKRPTQIESIRNNSVISAKSKSKKSKPNDGAINYVGNVVQFADAGVNKNHHIPVVAVTLPNGLANASTLFGNVITSMGVRNSATQPIRIPPLTVREGQVTDARTSASGESANIVLGSGIPSGGIVITDTIKPLKGDGSATIRLEGTKLLSTAKGLSLGGAIGSSSGSSINLVGSTNSVGGSTSTVLTPTGPQGQLYLTTVPGNSNTPFIQQFRNCRMGKGSGVKLLGSSQSSVGSVRQTFVLQEKDPS